MASTIKAAVDIRGVSQDLRALGDDLDDPIQDALEQHAGIIADMARGFLHSGAPSWATSSAFRDFGPSMRPYYDSHVARVSASIGSTHPGAPVWEWGGHIDPAAGGGIHTLARELKARSYQRQKIRMAGGRQGFEIPRDQPVYRAGQADLPALERDLESAVDRLCREHGF
jgi:hypothetical protein